MGKKIQRVLAPRLRFPEFTKTWTSVPMSKIYTFKRNNSLSRDKLNYESGSVRNIHYGDIHKSYPALLDADSEDVPFINDSDMPSSTKPENYCASGDIIFADASEDISDVGKALEVINPGAFPLVAGLHTILARPKSGYLAAGFGAYLFSSSAVRQQIQREAQGTKVLGIAASRIRSVLLPHPVEKDEQQKIAECLSSLDVLITAELRRLTALKSQRLGLMQKLLPIGRATAPSARLPGFENSGDWRYRKVSELLSKVSRPVMVDVNTTYQEIGTRSHGRGVFHKTPVSGKSLGDKRVFWVEEDALVINIVFAWEQSIAVTSEAERGMIASHRFPMYKAIAGISDVNFLKYLFLTRRGKELLEIASPGGAGRNKTLGQKDFENLEMLVPTSSNEQREIARCLGCIDDLIFAQDNRVCALQAHKKALVQRMFPLPGEVI